MNSYEFGTTKDGQVITAYVLENENGIRVEVLNLGCIIRQFWVPLKDGTYVNIVHGLDSVSAYEEDTCYFGAFIGRFANRIKNARFELNGKEYALMQNDGDNYLHGSWNRRVFAAEPYPADTLEESSRGIVFTYLSPDKEDGFPGNVKVKVTYFLENDNTLHLDYEAVPDQDTVLNFTNHSYYNLGAGQILTVKASRYLEGGPDIIPTGRILSVEEPSVMDLRNGKDVEKEYPSLGFYDHCYILDHEEGKEGEPDAILYAPGREITMEIRTKEPAFQVYSGNSAGVALETQMYPCGPNFPQFPSCVVKAGQTRKWSNLYKIIV